MYVAIIAGVIIAVALVVLLLVWLARTPEPVSVPDARSAFEAQRPTLERLFLEATKNDEARLSNDEGVTKQT